MPPFRRPDLWLPPLALMAATFYFSAQPSLELGLGPLELFGRKLVHFAEYALLCLLWWRAFEHRLGPRRAALLAFAITSAYAATDELHQSFIEGRHGTPVDWLIDTAGAGLMAIVLRSRLRRGAAA
ncbi:MAG TPA: VanZ family protein [Thermoleophilaceae bacterium]|nr:VanZ family protein [Thermoleophilaceae bacterium]